MITPWTHLLESFAAGDLDARQLVHSFDSIKCSHSINSNQQHGIIISACTKKVLRCELCEDYYVVKISQGTALQGRKGYGVFENEVEVLMQINNAMKTLRPEFQLYREFVLAYVKHYVSPTSDIVLVTKLVPYLRNDPKTLKELLIKGCSTEALCVIIIQVFMTLEIISKCVRGFVHMDLLLSQIFLKRWHRNALSLRVDEKTTFRLPKQDFWPVIGDFGFAVTTRNKDDFFKPGQIHPVQDVFRFFYDLRIASKQHRVLSALVDTLVFEIFGNVNLSRFETRDGYLTSAECYRLGKRIERYTDVMAYSSTLMRFA